MSLDDIVQPKIGNRRKALNYAVGFIGGGLSLRNLKFFVKSDEEIRIWTKSSIYSDASSVVYAGVGAALSYFLDDHVQGMEVANDIATWWNGVYAGATLLQLPYRIYKYNKGEHTPSFTQAFSPALPISIPTAISFLGDINYAIKKKISAYKSRDNQATII